MNVRKIVSIVWAALLPACWVQAQEPPALPCAKGDVKCASAERVKSPARTKSYWSAALAKPLDQRFGTAPDELLVFLNLDNIADEIPNSPRAAVLPVEFAKDVRDAIAGLPAEVKSAVDKKLAGIYFVKDLGGTGYTDYAHAYGIGRDAGYVVLDMDVLQAQTANAWATWKESTPFRSDPGAKLEAVIETAAQDNRKNAIQYILLHELGHILSIGENIHPVWDKPPNNDPNLDRFPFAHLSWEILQAENRYASRFDAAFPERKDVVYYFGARLDGMAMFSIYEKLERTNFPTLYAAARPGDDFAESFASYVHTVMMKRPWEIRLYRQGKLTRTIGLCWPDKRCAEKRRILETLLRIKP